MKRFDQKKPTCDEMKVDPYCALSKCLACLFSVITSFCDIVSETASSPPVECTFSSINCQKEKTDLAD